jgi:hypothetical protein
MAREDWIGKSCIYADPLGVERNALITAVHGMTAEDGEPTSVNLVFVEDDPSKYDQYGHQIGRQTSVVSQALQPAHGMFFRI